MPEIGYDLYCVEWGVKLYSLPSKSEAKVSKST